MILSKWRLKAQLSSLRKTPLFNTIKDYSVAQEVPLSVVLAIASRETNMKNILGDYQGKQYHGVGIMQVDIQHVMALIARNNGTWKTNPEPLIEFAIKLIRINYDLAKLNFPREKYHWAGDYSWWKIASSAYNCGISNAIISTRAGDSDYKTTGKNYGRDVMERTVVLAELLDEEVIKGV